jgi:phosphoribosylformylglycinamidine cyclo-ligase
MQVGEGNFSLWLCFSFEILVHRPFSRARHRFKPQGISLPPNDEAIMTTIPSQRSAYSEAGVNINAGMRAVDLMKAAVQSTYGPEVLAGIGAFGGLFDAQSLLSMRAPVIVASTDGVGTKVKIAAAAGRYHSIGWDIVNHCVNDILVQGARPLFFMDYVASSVLNPEMVAEIVSGISAACRESGCAVLGGETAEMPGVYAPGELDLAGTIVGIVERDCILPRATLRSGDLLVGLSSSGPHTNGYSLIRRIFEHTNLATTPPGLGGTLLDALLAPHKSYLPLLRDELNSPTCRIKALAHITGGGFFDNIPRVMPNNLDALIRMGSWPIPPLFSILQDCGNIGEEEMFRVFNMGIGMIAILAAEDAELFRNSLGEKAWIIGELKTGGKKVHLI